MTDGQTSVDDFIGGKIVVEQERRGYHRSGHDAVFLAAACPAEPGETVVDLGAASGAAGLCVAARVHTLNLLFIERDARQAALCRRNIDRAPNRDILASATALEGDIEDLKSLFRMDPDLEASADHLICNPPYRFEGAGTVSPHEDKKGAHVLGAKGLQPWITAARRLLKKKGTATFIFPAGSMDHLLMEFSSGFGSFRVLPLYPLPGKPAHRVIVTGVKDGKGGMTLGRGPVLESEPGMKTPEAEAIERFGKRLTL